MSTPSSDFFSSMDQAYQKEVSNLDKSNPKLFIFFSGIAGSGKTLYAKELEKRFSGIRISSDGIRRLMQTYILPHYTYTVEWQEQFVSNFTDFFLKKHCHKNGLIIFDGSIDRRYSHLADWARKHGWQWVIIDLEVDQDILLKRLREKQADPIQKPLMTYEEYLSNLPKWVKDHENFIAEVKPDLIINNDGALQFKKAEDLIKSKLKIRT